MNHWAEGYTTEVEYTHGYYPLLDPLKLPMAFLYNGFKPPEIKTACELGFGQGVSINIHASGTNIKWYGNDFSPSQCSFANELAINSKNNAVLVDDSFEQYVQRTDLPEFDFISLHGIWSWVSDENRAYLINFIKKHLKFGGVLYISYNTDPGWSTFAPMRHLLTEHNKSVGSKANPITERISSSIDFAQELLNIDPIYKSANPAIVDKLSSLKAQDKNYLSHEYYNENWKLEFFSSMAQHLTEAKLSYVCSADYLSNVDGINLTQPQIEFLAKINDPIFKETVRDFIINQQFRRDYWVKGARPLSPQEKNDAFRQLKVMQTVPRDKIIFKVSAARDATLSEAIYNPIIDTLSNYQAISIGEIETLVSSKNITLPQIIEAAMILTGMGYISTVQDDHISEVVNLNTQKLNSHLMQRAIEGNAINTLASPVTGGGISVDRFSQLFMLAIKNGLTTDEQLAQYAAKVLDQKNEKIVVEGKVLKTKDENLQLLRKYAIEFNKKGLSIFKQLKII